MVCELAVRDDELDLGGIEDASPELAEGRDTRGKALGNQRNTWEHVRNRPLNSEGWGRQDNAGYRGPQAPLRNQRQFSVNVDV